MIDSEDAYLTYEIVYKVKYGKRLLRAYVGPDRKTYKRMLNQLQKRDDIRYLSTSITRTVVTLYD